MKIRNIILVVIQLCMFLGTSSCSDFLKEKNYTGQSAEKYFSTAQGYETLIYDCYAGLKDIYNSTDFASMGQLGTDMFTQTGPLNVNNMNQYTVGYSSAEGVVYSVWESLYTTLKDINAAIERSPSVVLKKDDKDGIEPEVLAQRVGEAKALRALCLFEIVRNWGKGPLMLIEPTSPSKITEYSDGPAFYNQILQDLNDAINVLPIRQTGGNYGRMSGAAAKHLRALVYLTRGYQIYADGKDFENAFKDAEDVYEHSGHKLLDDYRLVHSQANEINDEILFSIGFGTDGNYNTGKQYSWYTVDTKEGWAGLAKSALYGNANPLCVPTKYTYLLFDWRRDRRASVTFMSPLNGNPATSTDGRSAGKNWFECTNPTEKFALGDKVIYFPIPLEDDFKYWTEEDKAAVSYTVYNYPTGDVTDMSEDDYYLNSYQVNDTRSRRTFLSVWKFKDSNPIYDEYHNYTGTRDMYIFRLAETCLIAAEAAVKNNDNVNALKYLNKIRERAAHYAQESGLPLYSGTVTLDDILDERALELLGETPRWNDLQRMGKLAERALKYNWDINHITGNVSTALTEETYKNKYCLRPIPLSWLNALSNGQDLGNNQGW